jgi:hypothetical protein
MFLDGWVDRWVDGWKGVKALLRIAYSNQKELTKISRATNKIKFYIGDKKIIEVDLG